MKGILLTLGALLIVVVFGVSCSVGGFACNWISKAGDVVAQQVDPAALLAKYEWFKDSSAALDAKQASIKVLRKREADLKDEYVGVKRKDWSRADKEQWNLWEEEASGLTASFNDLASQYNAEMAKINYRFCNIGMLPQGASTPLPREYKPYDEE